MLGRKVYGSLYNSLLKVSSVDQLLLGVEHEVALHEDAWSWWPQSRQHILCTGTFWLIILSLLDPFADRMPAVLMPYGKR